MALLSAAAVALAAIAFLGTNGPRTRAEAAPETRVTAAAAPHPHPTGSATPTRKPAKPHKPKKKVVRRGSTFVEVYNNSGISGLAGSTAARAQGAGWQVVGSGNWYGTVATSTVYYPLRLKAAAALLAKDLGIGRVKPLVAPMRGDRLTVILTSDFS